MSHPTSTNSNAVACDLKSRFSLNRQVRLIAGSLVLLGLTLAHFVHPAFVGVTAFVGLGLVVAGVTDFCGLCVLLARLPWNRHRST